MSTYKDYVDLKDKLKSEAPTREYKNLKNRVINDYASLGISIENPLANALYRRCN